jgi:hypothetical protein
MKIINKTSKTLDLGKSYLAKTQFVINQDGNVEQKTVLYKDKGSRKRVIFTTPHGELAITRKSAIFKFIFNRHQFTPDEMEINQKFELEEIIDFLNSGFGRVAVESVDKGFEILDAQKAA